MAIPATPSSRSPDVDQPDHYNNFGKLKRDIPKQKLRQQTSEHPFATISEGPSPSAEAFKNSLIDSAG